MSDEALPSYDELPVGVDAPPGSSWGVWDDPYLGSLNLLTPERVMRGIGTVRAGTVYRLDLELHLPDPPLFNRSRLEHVVHGLAGGAGHDDELRSYNTQSSSQWDGFRHISHPVHGFYGGIADEDHGMNRWAERGIVGRAVVADVGRWREAQGRPLVMDAPDPIEPEELEATLDAQGTPFEAGDVLLMRTGWVGWYRTLDQDGRERVAADLASPGLRPGEQTARVLWNLHPAALAADNPAVELWPLGALAGPDLLDEVRADRTRMPELFVHTALLPLLGLPLGELWDLEGLAADCAADGRWDCLLVSSPLHVAAGVASPPNAVAIR